ncbi:MAG: ABC transporter permease [Thermoplasmata archaeon]|nr:ABC transporter permease [Thermoplasmata archaeon]
MKTSTPLAPSRAFAGTAAFLWTEVLVQGNERMAMLTSMVVPGIILVFVEILNPALIGVALVGAILFSTFTMGQRVLNEAAYLRIDHKANDLYLAGPMTPEAYFLGMSVGIMIIYLAPTVFLGVLAVVVVPLSLGTGLLLFALAAAVWLFAASTGYIFSTFFLDNRAIWAYSSLFFNVFGVLAPVFYPLGLFPSALRPIVLLMPPSAAAALVQSVIGAATLAPWQTALAAGGLVAETVAVFVFAIYWARRTVMAD